MIHIHKPIPLSAPAFAPFGDVIAPRGIPATINSGHTLSYGDLAKIDVGNNNGQPMVSMYQSTPLPTPISIEIMERHPLGSQMFMPLSDNPYLVVVAPRGDFDESKIKVFLAQPTQGVNYRAGTWHHYSLALGAVSDFLVLDRAGRGEKCQEIRLKNPFLIQP